MRIGIIGSGNVGGSLGRVWADRGHDVCFGVRDTTDEDVQRLVADIGERVRAAGLRDAAEYGEVVVLAVPGDAVKDAAARITDVVAGKPLVDATNRPDADRPQSVAILAAAPDARLVKAFNTVGYEWFADPTADDETASMFVAGDDREAKDAVVGLVEDCGFEPVDAGPLEAAAMLEDLARLWIHLSRAYGRDVAFRLLRR